jgi:hypothetical protein
MMVLSSSSFQAGQDIPQKHGKKIENVSPELSWEGAPRQTKSFALSVVAGSYVHWLGNAVNAISGSPRLPPLSVGPDTGYSCGLYALRVVPRAPNFCALRRVSSNFDRA